MRLLDEHGTSVGLSKVLGKGGEAEVWAVATHTASVAKIYHLPSTEHESKLRTMIAEPPVDPTRGRGHVSICWPEALLFDPASRKNLGFLMPRIDLSKHRELFKIYNARTRQSEAPNFTWAYLVTAAENIASVIDSIHAKGYIVGDMNESNFFISSQALATIVDCDSMQVTTSSGIFRCTVAKPEYMAPELRGANLSKAIRTQPQDNFALAVLIFHLLMEGFHPYSGRWNKAGEAPSIEERITGGDSPYGSSSRISPSPGAPPFEVLPAPVRELFVRAFYQGNRDPARRPSAKEWQQALHTLGATLLTCRANSQHRYAQHLSRCPWCERAVLLKGFDPFPAPGMQNALPSQPFQPQPARAQPARPQPNVYRPAQPGSRPATQRFQIPARPFTSNTILASRTLFRIVLFVVPFLSAAIGLLLVPSLGWRALPLLRNTCLLAAALGLARNLQIRNYRRALFSLLAWLVLYSLITGSLAPGSLSGALSRSLAEAWMAFFASRSLLHLLRMRMDHYRLVGRTGRVAAVLASSLAMVPLAALTTGVSSLSLSSAAATAARALTPSQPVASSQVTLSTCAGIAGRCGCTAKTVFHPGETVNFLALSSAMPRLEIQIEPSGQLPTRINISTWRNNGSRHCAVSQYKIPAHASDGFFHLHVLVNANASDQTRIETGFSVLP